MKHTVGVIVHRDEKQLNWMVQDLVDLGYQVVIHADFKYRETILDCLDQNKHLVLPNSHDVRRAHVSLLNATLDLMEKALESDFDFFHLISGQDLAIKSPSQVDELIAYSNNTNFINHYHVPVDDTDVDPEDVFSSFEVRGDRIPRGNYTHYALRGGMGLFDQKRYPDTLLWKHFEEKYGGIRSFWRVYRLFFKRRVPNIEFYVGSAWFTISRELVQFIVEETKRNPELLNFMKNASFPDEIYFHTLVMNSPYKDKILNSDLRYITWFGGCVTPNTIRSDEAMAACFRSNGAFARKWRIPTKEEFDDIISKRPC